MNFFICPGTAGVAPFSFYCLWTDVLLFSLALPFFGSLSMSWSLARANGCSSLSSAAILIEVWTYVSGYATVLFSTVCSFLRLELDLICTCFWWPCYFCTVCAYSGCMLCVFSPITIRFRFFLLLEADCLTVVVIFAAGRITIAVAVFSFTSLAVCSCGFAASLTITADLHFTMRQADYSFLFPSSSSPSFY